MRKSLLLLGFLGFLSGCSEVNLNYQVPGRLQQIGLASTTLNAGGTPSALANLWLDAQLEIEPAQMAGLTLYVVLSNPSGPIKTLSIPAETFFSENTLFWGELPPGEANLRVELHNASGQTLGFLEHALMLSPESQDAVHFRFSKNAQNEGLLSLATAENSTEPLAFAFASNVPGNTVPGSSTQPTNSTGSQVPPVQGSNTTSPELKLRLVEAGQTTLQFVWEPPPGVEVAHYQLLLDGEVVATQHPTTNYRATGLSTNTEYTFTVVPVLADGSRLPEVPLAATTGTGSSGGGGGGGGGSSTPNLPPVIDHLTPSRSTAPTGYPVGLSTQASDELNLPDSAYTWSCEACGDASFQTPTTGTAGTTTGKNAVWNAPTTPGTYVLTLSVSDGVNPAVTRTQSIVVEQRLGSVIVEGVYE